MNAFFSLATFIDAVIAFTVLECLALIAYRQFTGRGLVLRDFLANMVSGLCLMLALRCAVQDAGAVWVVLSLLAAGVAHGSDILMRLRHRTRRLQNRPVQRPSAMHAAFTRPVRHDKVEA